MPFSGIEHRFERRVEIRVVVKIFPEEVQNGVGGKGPEPAVVERGPRRRSGEVQEWRNVSEHYGHGNGDVSSGWRGSFEVLVK